VSFAQNGTNLTINLSNGSVQRSYTPSTAATSTSDQYLNSSFPATKAYNVGTYSGSLSQSGSPYVISGSYSSASSKNVSVTSGTYDVHEYILCIGANDKTQWGYSVGGSPDTYYYNDDIYSGTLPMTQYLIYSSSYTDYYYCRLPMTIGQYYNSANRTVAAVYSGTVNYAGYDTHMATELQRHGLRGNAELLFLYRHRQLRIKLFQTCADRDRRQFKQPDQPELDDVRHNTNL
jgi:hypothetical protein